MPRRGAPQGQGPGSDTADALAAPETAKTERSLSTLRLAQFLQVTCEEPLETIFSNFVPHSRQQYSKMGMNFLPFNYTR
jgi:hypothetical protein